MGIICCTNRKIPEVEISSFNRIISQRSFSIDLKKLITIQTWFRKILSRLHLNKYFESLKESINIQLDNKKLINIDVISECKSELLYQKLLIDGKIESFMETVNKDKKLRSILRILEKFSFFIPYHIVTSPNEVYKGSWNSNKKYNGYGVIYEFDLPNNKDSRREGIFRDGLLYLWGRIIVSNGEILFGNFKNGKLNGEGQYKREDGSSYIGKFYEGLPQGEGKEIFADGAVFEGKYKAGKKVSGKIIWKDGSSYQGNFINDLFNGDGVYIWGDNRKYDGKWKDGKMHGKGIFIYADGSNYVGDFIENKKDGQGKYEWDKNKYYEGQWKNDLQNGEGEYFKNGQKFKGYWVNGRYISDKMKIRKNNFTFVRKRPTLGAISVKNHVKTNPENVNTNRKIFENTSRENTFRTDKNNNFQSHTIMNQNTNPSPY